jgi:outer membrane receptor protein involved in Fe transport
MRILTVSQVLFLSAGLMLSTAATAADIDILQANNDVLEEVVVTATLREQRLVDVPLSISVLDEQTLRDAGQQHFEDVLASVPNLHWASATSRPRFFQIRGIGEREQWEGAPNPSVGFLIDDIDFSGIGMAATLFDVNQIEVLRGPQGLRYGANALAGLIVLQGNAPEREFGLSTEVSLGDYDTQSFGAVATGPVDALKSAWRIGVQRYQSDGFRDDPYLQRDDTNGRDELTARAKWRWEPSEHTRVDLTWLHTDLDNDYDGWSIDNSRRSQADKPGKDTQEADAFALRMESRIADGGQLTLIATTAQADGEYSYDEDWGNTASWAPYTYDYFYRALSKRRARTLEARYATDAPEDVGDIAWLVGAYVLDVDYRIHEARGGEFIDPDFPEYSGSSSDSLASRYDALSLAAFAQADGKLSERWGWSFGLRAEQRSADYRDRGMQDEALRVTDTSQRDSMLGGQATLHLDVADNTRVFATLGRGYKAGGFNLGRAAALRERFAPEYLWSIDVGVKGSYFGGRLYTDVTAFYMKRDDMQVSTGIQEEGVAGSYIFLTDNAAGGSNTGIEASARWQVLRQLELGATLGLLHSGYSGYRPTGVDISDRDQAHAPEYQASLNATWRAASGWMARVDFVAVDDYYFDVPPADQRAAAHSLTHLKAGYEGNDWGAYVWARNVFDEEYVVRGFYFGNEPPLWEDKLYLQLGEPRQLGVSATWKF